LQNAPTLAAEVKYVPLPASAYATTLERLAKMERGTAFGGMPEVGVPIDELLSRPVK
jgi:phosphate transport system substrate-binding protein